MSLFNAANTIAVFATIATIPSIIYPAIRFFRGIPKRNLRGRNKEIKNIANLLHMADEAQKSINIMSGGRAISVSKQVKGWSMLASSQIISAIGLITLVAVNVQIGLIDYSTAIHNDPGNNYLATLVGILSAQVFGFIMAYFGQKAVSEGITIRDALSYDKTFLKTIEKRVNRAIYLGLDNKELEKEVRDKLLGALQIEYLDWKSIESIKL